ncbi:hypothetical protein, partial [Pseudomonas savastanoi]|uniref:hypothetical protein n=1 Tax=Pseudomonas savastanoi TaxID=29438 RepID=UPI001C810B74
SGLPACWRADGRSAINTMSGPDSISRTPGSLLQIEEKPSSLTDLANEPDVQARACCQWFRKIRYLIALLVISDVHLTPSAHAAAFALCKPTYYRAAVSSSVGSGRQHIMIFTPRSWSYSTCISR